MEGGDIISVNNSELLKYISDNAMIDMAYVQNEIEMQKRKELLNKHPYKIWQGTDGYWNTYLPDNLKGAVKYGEGWVGSGISSGEDARGGQEGNRHTGMNVNTAE